MRQLRIGNWRFSIGATAILIGVVALGTLGAPFVAEAQQARKVYRLGFLHPTIPPYAPSDPTALAKWNIELAGKYRSPAIYEWRDQVKDGGLMAYGSSLSGLSQRAAAYIDRIFNGADPDDNPIEQPTKFELVINLKTAKALGVKIPQTILVRADEVIR